MMEIKLKGKKSDKDILELELEQDGEDVVLHGYDNHGIHQTLARIKPNGDAKYIGNSHVTWKQ